MEVQNALQDNIEGVTVCSGIVSGEGSESIEQDARKHQKRPKRILHFSDGEMVEYSSDDETDAPKTEAPVVTADPKSLDWMPWAWYHTALVGSKLLHGCDYVGEALADFLGITSPKYQFEIDEHERMHAAQAEEAHREDMEMGGWNENHRNNIIVTSNVTSSE